MISTVYLSQSILCVVVLRQARLITANQPSLLRRVLFAKDCYICPKADGCIILGATVEAGSYDASVTPAGLMHILTHALKLVSRLANLALEETWVELRPTTPDKGPILGKTKWNRTALETTTLKRRTKRLLTSKFILVIRTTQRL
jgi:glycine/D-amino acid oxidase-like deaminating enzyme